VVNGQGMNQTTVRAKIRDPGGGIMRLILILVFLAVGCGDRLIDVPEVQAAEVHAQRASIQSELDQRDRQFDERLARMDEEAQERLQAAEPELLRAEQEAAARQKMRRVKRWIWGSPVESRSKLWNVPHTEDTAATATGLLRICMTEADGAERDCIAIWQVLRNIRSTKCSRQRIRRITECDDNGETMLSAMRRAQKFALGVAPPRSRRTRWITELELSCEQPPSYPGTEREWARQYSRACAPTAKLVQQLVSGQSDRRVIKGVSPIAWGGRCEDDGGACDDPIACRRGLGRIPGTDTANAFWCRTGSPGCRTTIEPICLELGFAKRS